MEDTTKIGAASMTDLSTQASDPAILIARLQRELEIEAALERVRAHSLAMHQSDELEQVALTLYDQLVELGYSLSGALIMLFDKEKRNIELWIATRQLSTPAKIDLPYDPEMEENAIIKDLWNGIENGIHLFNKSYSGETKNEYFRYVQKYNNEKIPEPIKKLELDSESWTSYLVADKKSVIGFDSWSGPIPTISDQDFQILLKFARVFEQAYTRFLDLQKAEAQAREAQIVAALERVRSRTMAMHKTNELSAVIYTLFKQLTELGIEIVSSWVVLMHTESNELEFWITHSEGNAAPTFVKTTEYETFEREMQAWRAGQDISLEIPSKIAKGIVKRIFRIDINPPAEKPFWYISQHWHRYGYIGLSTWKHATEEEKNIIGRFAKVFEQTYTRFLDIQKAEAQAREAQIEAALERVRAQAMAMHTSQELSEVVHELRKQMGVLGQKDLNTCVIHLHDESPDFIHAWAAIRPPESVDKILESTARVPKKGLLIIEEAMKAYAANQKDYVLINEGEKIKQWLGFIHGEAPAAFAKIKESVEVASAEDPRSYWSFADFAGGSLLIVTSYQPEEASRALLRRFANVFGLAYRRFADLKKAEAQAREAQIEAALERVRSASLAMHQSDEIYEVSQVLREQLSQLGTVDIESVVIINYDHENNHIIGSYVYRDPDDKEGPLRSGRGVYVWDATERGRLDKEMYFSGETEYTLVADYEMLLEWYQYLHMVTPDTVDYDEQGNLKVPDYLYYNYAKFNGGALLLITSEETSPFSKYMLKRMAVVFEQSYVRFLDLQRAEAQAREAIKQASLDRVRAEIASMRSAEDLQRITPLVWHELTTLGVPFIRCGVFIIDEGYAHVRSYLSTTDGHSLTVMDLPFGTNQITDQVVAHWKKKRVFQEHWDREQFVNWMQSMIEQHRLQNREEILGTTAPPESLYLNFIPFRQGMLYVGNTAELSADEIELVQSLASAFSIAYARYDDFKQLEEAKRQVEATLDELKHTQAQLIQSEKMASLGELTAGIAHEIQNPLNFVNNYSEVNVELIDELEKEVEKDNKEEVKALLADLRDNQAKIHHHGQRADSIVRSMMQHSRTNTGTLEPTDLNALADEYLRLAYHGLRAKDSTFQAEYTTDFDPNLPKVGVVPADLGRALLNIINNAFQACAERSRQQPEGYNPAVKVATRNLQDLVEIQIRDNGPGIPDAIKDKIFQPFFTTRPTGQGTGLGLSLAYDIVKAHGGEVIVESEEGLGTTMTIPLPIY